MHKLGHEFGPGTNPYKVTTESEKAWHKFLRTDEKWWPKRLTEKWLTRVIHKYRLFNHWTGSGETVGVVHIGGTCEGQGSFLYRGLSQCPLSSDCPLTPALVELQERTGTPLFVHGCQGSQLRSSSLHTFPTESFPRLKWVLFSKKRSHSFKFPIQH